MRENKNGLLAGFVQGFARPAQKKGGASAALCMEKIPLSSGSMSAVKSVVSGLKAVVSGLKAVVSGLESVVSAVTPVVSS